jgi:hypothetical protein
MAPPKPTESHSARPSPRKSGISRIRWRDINRFNAFPGAPAHGRRRQADPTPVNNNTPTSLRGSPRRLAVSAGPPRVDERSVGDRFPTD